MVVRVAERAAMSEQSEIWIATDHPEVEAAARRHGLNVLLTRPRASQRYRPVAEVARVAGWHDDTIVVNVQETSR